MSFGSILRYDDAFLDSIDLSDLERLVENCFTSKTKNYDLLAKLTARLSTFQLCPLHHAMSILEDKAVEVMLANYRDGSIAHIKSPSYSLDTLWYIIKDPLQYNMSMDTKKEKIINIAEQFFALRSNFTKNDLEKYSLLVPSSKVLKLIIDKKINTAEMNLAFPKYEIDNLSPLLKGINYNSIEDVLLTRTYSENKNISEVKAVYTNLLHNNSKMASSIMHYTAINIINGDDLKIVFGHEVPGFGGGYIPFLN